MLIPLKEVEEESTGEDNPESPGDDREPEDDCDDGFGDSMSTSMLSSPESCDKT